MGTTITIRADDSLRDALAEKAEAMGKTVSELVREILIEAMKNAGGNQAGAARALSTTPRILSYRLRKHGLHEAFRPGG